MCAGHQPPAGDRKRGSTLKCAQVISLVTGERGTDGMAKFIQYDMDNADALCGLGKALSSPARLEILKLLYGRDLIIGSIAKELGLPVSSTAFHLRVLEEAGLISMEELPNTRGSMKLCRCSADRISVDLAGRKSDIDEIFSAEMPVGAFSSCRVTPTCGLWSVDGMIGNEDAEYCFYLPQRMNAAILWSSSGYLEYKFANGVPQNRTAKKLTLSMELCSEAPSYKEDWKSDITLWINGRECGTWTSPGDFGGRRGRLNPPCWANGKTQYGMQVIWKVDEEGTCINGKKASQTSIKQLFLSERAYVAVKIGNKPDSRYVGGFNIFGKGYGDYNQDIVLTIAY